MKKLYESIERVNLQSMENLISVEEYSKLDIFCELAAVSGGFNNIRLAVFGDEKNYPHFHFYRDTPRNKGIPNKGHYGGCIMLMEPKYYIHGTHSDVMTKKEMSGMIEFLNSKQILTNVPVTTVWQLLILLWNATNANMPQINSQQDIPDYTYDMDNYK